MNFALLAFVLLLNGAQDHRGAMFDSEAACEEAKETITQSIGAYNAQEPNKVVEFAIVCLPLAKAPLGASL